MDANVLLVCEFYFSDSNTDTQEEHIDKINNVWLHEHPTIEHGVVIDGLTKRVFMFDAPNGPISECSFEEFLLFFKQYVFSKASQMTDAQYAMADLRYDFMWRYNHGSDEQQQKCSEQYHEFLVKRSEAEEEAIKQWCVQHGVPSSYCDTDTNRKLDQALINAKRLYSSGFINDIPIGTTEGLIQIHRFIFEGVIPSAGALRTRNVSIFTTKNKFRFASSVYLKSALKEVERMPEDTLKHIVQKFVEMNICCPFEDGNGRTIRIWLDMMLKRSLGKMVNWKSASGFHFDEAFKRAPFDDYDLRFVLSSNLTNDVNNINVITENLEYSFWNYKLYFDD